jgi:hypothetical protein
MPVILATWEAIGRILLPMLLEKLDIYM